VVAVGVVAVIGVAAVFAWRGSGGSAAPAEQEPGAQQADADAGFSSLDRKLLPAGPGRLTSDCFDITIPAGFSFDLSASTQLLGTGVHSGAAFSDANHAAMTVACLGPTKTVAESYQDSLHTFVEAMKANVTYKVERADGFVISGYIHGGNVIYYQRTMKVGPALIEVKVTWPAALRDQYDSRVIAMVTGVTPGAGILRLAGKK